MTDRTGTNGRRHRLRLGRRSVLAAVVAGAVLALTAVPASAAGNVPATAPLDLWGVDGTANAVVVSGSTVYVGGSFANAVRFTQSAPRQNVMALTLGTPKPVDSLSAFQSPTNGTVRALAVDASWLYLGGDFTSPGTRVARVSRATGAVDPMLERHRRQAGAGHGARRARRSTSSVTSPRSTAWRASGRPR